MDQNISGRAKRGREKISSHNPEVERGAMGLLVSPFLGKKNPSVNTPGSVVLWEPTAPLGTSHYRMAATPRNNSKILLSGLLHAQKGT